MFYKYLWCRAGLQVKQVSYSGVTIRRTHIWRRLKIAAHFWSQFRTENVT